MLIIGLTGGIGSGKSTVASLFRSHGAAIIDTDDIAHAITAAGQPALDEISGAFGSKILLANGELDRASLRRQVFSDAEARKMLEHILHPRIRQAVAEELNQPSVASYHIVVVPLLFECGGYSSLIQRSLVVDCPVSMQIERAMARSRLSEEEVNAVIAAQLPRVKRLAQADDIIVNDAGLQELAREVTKTHKKYIGLA